MIDWVSIVRHSHRRFSNCIYFAPRIRRRKRGDSGVTNVPQHPFADADGQQCNAPNVRHEDERLDRPKSAGCYQVRRFLNPRNVSSPQFKFYLIELRLLPFFYCKSLHSSVLLTIGCNAHELNVRFLRVEMTSSEEQK